MCLIFLSALFLPSYRPLLASQEDRAKVAWRAIVPAIEVFWKEYQTSPEKLKEDAWPLISMLKNYIKAFPDSKMVPRAYYILGEAYASISYWPEAEAHWKIVTRYFPNSRWTNQALNSLIMYYERSNNQKKLKRFYREIMRRFPDSVAAHTAEVLMARQALSRGDLNLAKEVAKRVSSSSPKAEVDVPELLDLKARIAIKEKQPQKAIEMLVRYLNLIRNPSIRATTLFNIAETYRKIGDVLKARKYYALIRRDFKGQPQYLFARFRMLQLREQARKRLSKYTKGKVPPPDFYESEQVFKEILKRYPHHPLTLEVEKEYVATELQKKDFLSALKLAEKYLRKDPESPYSKEMLLMADEAKNGLISTKYDVSRLKKILSFARPFLKNNKGSKQIHEYIRSVAEIKWVELQKQLIKNGQPNHALKEYWQFTKYFKEKTSYVTEARRLAAKALILADESYLKAHKYIKLINFYLSNKKQIDTLRVPEHFLYLAKALGQTGLDEPSLRAFQKAWDIGHDQSIRCTILLDWTGQLEGMKRFKAAQDTITLMNLFCPEESMTDRALFYKSRLALWQKDYRAALSMAMDSLNMRKNSQNVIQAAKAAIYLARWDIVRQVMTKHKGILSKREYLAIARMWGDTALSLGEQKEASLAYSLLKENSQEDQADFFRISLASSLNKEPAVSKGIWQKAAKKSKGLWADAAKAEASFSKFMEKAGSQL